MMQSLLDLLHEVSDKGYSWANISAYRVEVGVMLSIYCKRALGQIGSIDSDDSEAVVSSTFVLGPHPSTKVGFIKAFVNRSISCLINREKGAPPILPSLPWWVVPIVGPANMLLIPPFLGAKEKLLLFI